MWGHACIRLMRVLAVVLVSAGLTGCVAYTGGYDYGGGYYSAGGYYAAPVVAPIRATTPASNSINAHTSAGGWPTANL